MCEFFFVVNVNCGTYSMPKLIYFFCILLWYNGVYFIWYIGKIMCYPVDLIHHHICAQNLLRARIYSSAHKEKNTSICCGKCIVQQIIHIHYVKSMFCFFNFDTSRRIQGTHNLLAMKYKIHQILSKNHQKLSEIDPKSFILNHFETWFFGSNHAESINNSTCTTCK